MTMRDRTRAWLVALAVVATMAAPTAIRAEDMVIHSPGTLKFTAIPNMPRCASAAILRGNPRTGPAWVLLKLDSGCRVPWHWHTANETLVVISGQGTLATKDGPTLRFAPGAYAELPSNHAHQASCARACLLFNGADAAFDIHYVDASGAEIPLAEALRASQKTKRRK
jgi:quercetin dioxygenase-like cupin family protein